MDWGSARECVNEGSWCLAGNGEGSEVSDESKKDGGLVVGDGQEPEPSASTKPCPKSLRRCMCHVKKVEGALAEAHAGWSSFLLVTQ